MKLTIEFTDIEDLAGQLGELTALVFRQQPEAVEAGITEAEPVEVTHTDEEIIAAADRLEKFAEPAEEQEELPLEQPEAEVVEFPQAEEPEVEEPAEKEPEPPAAAEAEESDLKKRFRDLATDDYDEAAAILAKLGYKTFAEVEENDALDKLAEALG